MEPQVGSPEKTFAAARAKFEALCVRLESAETLQMTHGDLEIVVEKDGCEVLRLMYQENLDLRTAREAATAPVAVADATGVVRTHRRHGDRALETLFGAVIVVRLGYGKRGVPALHPLDAELNLPLERYSHGVRRRVAELTAMGAFDEATATIAATTGAHAPKRQVEEMARRAAVDFDLFYREAVFECVVKGDILALTLDGKGIVMRAKDLRPATAKAAATHKQKMGKRRSKGEKPYRKRIATVAAVYSIDRFKRTPEQIVNGLKPAENQEKRPRPHFKRVFASIEKSVEAVVAEIFAEADRQDPERRKVWVALVDGNKTQIRLLKAKAEELGVTLTIVVDIIHVLEYLWRAAFVFNPEGTKQAEDWVTERLLAILRGKASDVAAGIRRSATRRGLAKKVRAAADRCANYLLKYAEFLRYDEYLAAGMPIATGVIEGACRHLIKDRMDVTGARWSAKGAEAVLRLRALRSSGDFDEYWTFHLEQECLRNHAPLYAASTPPTLMQPGRPAPVPLDRGATTRARAA